MTFFKDMERALTEAIEINEGNVPLKEREGMAASTFYVDANEEVEIE